MPCHPPQLADVARMMNALQCGAVIIDRTGRLVSVNDRAAEMYARTRSALESHALDEFYADAEGREMVQRILRHFDEPRETESYLPLPDGRRLPVMVAGRTLGDAAPLADYRLYTLLDISRLKETEAALQQRYVDIARLSDTVLEQALGLKDYSKTLEQRVTERTQQLVEANMDAIYMLALASEAKDDDTGAHVRRIEHSAEKLALGLGLPAPVAREIGYSAILHDVGKIHVADRILKKEGKLNHREWRIMRAHTLTGEHILSDKPFFAVARQIARSHHENWDGSGYPDGLAGDAIPLPARIVRLADVYDALVSRRPYKKPFPPPDAIRAILDGRGTLFDPQIVQVFQQLCERDEFAPTPPVELPTAS